MSHWRKVVLGSLTCAISLQALWLIARWTFDISTPAWMNRLPELIAAFLGCFPALVTLILYPFLLVYYVLWLAQVRGLSPLTTGAWALAFLLAGPVAMPAFFFAYMSQASASVMK